MTSEFDQTNSFITTKLTTDENGNLSLEFPDELLQAVDWKEGDSLAIELFAGRIIFRKINPPEVC